MADPVTPEATESFGNRGYDLKGLRNRAMGGMMGLHQSKPDEGFMRAAMAASVPGIFYIFFSTETKKKTDLDMFRNSDLSAKCGIYSSLWWLWVKFNIDLVH